jgi:sugar transferase (PEP-CTERM system associated)
MRIRVMGCFLCLHMLLLGLIEFAVILLVYLFAARWLIRGGVSISALFDESLLFAGSVICAMIAMGLYSQRLRDRFVGIMQRVTAALVIGGLVTRLLSMMFLDTWVTALVLAGTLTCAWLALFGTRKLAEHCQDGELFKRRVLVIGAGRRAARILQLRRRTDNRGFRVIGYLPTPGDTEGAPAERLLDWPEDLLEFVRRRGVHEIVVAMDDRRGQFPYRQLLNCRLAGIVVCELGVFLERETGKLFLDTLTPSWLIFGGGFRQGWLRGGIGRCFDLLMSAVLLIVGWPLMLLVVLAIKMEDGLAASVLYRQDRVGQYGQIFQVVKFRSMRVDAEADGMERWAQKNDDRTTRVGAVIRKIRLDELPQLVNVMRGAMSFVGPRPERPSFVATLGSEIPYYVERHTVKPGITGWAQLCYPYGASQHDAIEKLQYDLFYVKNRGLVFDIFIILQTLEVILLGRGAR